MTLQANQIFVSVNNNFLSPQHRPAEDELDRAKPARPWSLSNADLGSIASPKVTSEYTVPKEFVTSDLGKISRYQLQIDDADANQEEPATGEKDYAYGTAGARPHFISVLRKAQVP